MIFMSAYLLVFSLQLVYMKLSHWAHFTVCRFICVYVCVFCILCFFFILYHCNTVGLSWWDWSLIRRTLSSLSALTLLVGLFWLVLTLPDMTCNVCGRMLNLNPTYNHSGSEHHYVGYIHVKWTGYFSGIFRLLSNAVTVSFCCDSVCWLRVSACVG